VLRGTRDARANKLTSAIISAADTYSRKIADVDASKGHMLASELTARQAAVRAEYGAALEVQAAALKALRADLDFGLQTVSPVKAGRDCDFHQVMQDRELRDILKGMKPTDRAIKIHNMLDNPLMHLPMVDAVLRVPAELTGMSYDEHRALRVKTFAALRPSEFAAMDTELEQVNTAMRALSIAASSLIESGVVANANDQTQPALHALLVAGDSSPLRWLPPTVDQRYAPEGGEA
jgi:hypothetical protein